MKTLIIAAALLISSIGNATSLHPDTFAMSTGLKVVKQDQGFGTVDHAKVTVNPTTRTIKLTLYFPQICPPPRPGGFSCMAVSRGPLTIEVPIVAQTTGQCGATVYVGKLDRRPVDGNLEQIRVIDYRTMTCEIALPANMMTEVNFVEITAGFGAPAQTFRIDFRGPALKSPFIR
ncbi:MAG: hypothetical protein ABL958_08090 [Bdellovibrionia bacterium]